MCTGSISSFETELESTSGSGVGFRLWHSTQPLLSAEGPGPKRRLAAVRILASTACWMTWSPPERLFPGIGRGGTYRLQQLGIGLYRLSRVELAEFVQDVLGRDPVPDLTIRRSSESKGRGWQAAQSFS